MRYVFARRPDFPTAAGAEAWLTGLGDLAYAGRGLSVPAPVQIGVLAHGDLARLRDLGRLAGRGSVQRAWGRDMARLAGEVAARTGTPGRLADLQRRMLVPLELDVLARRREATTRSDAVRVVRQALDAWVGTGGPALSGGCLPPGPAGRRGPSGRRGGARSARRR